MLNTLELLKKVELQSVVVHTAALCDVCVLCCAVLQAVKAMGYDDGDRNFGVEVPVEQQAHWWHNRWVRGGGVTEGRRDLSVRATACMQTMGCRVACSFGGGSFLCHTCGSLSRCSLKLIVCYRPAPPSLFTVGQ